MSKGYMPKRKKLNPFGLKVTKISKEDYDKVQEEKKKKARDHEDAVREFRKPENH